MSRGLVCLKCRLFYRIKKNGVVIEEGMPDGSGDSAPYKLWMADLYECTGCGSQLVTGFGQVPLAEHYQDRYARVREHNPPLAHIADCGGARP